ncbi:LysR family transcriptional regulator [Sphingomonas sp.]|uniref:LysR family transcriptional regulator n=1 Tax=Sphingomonas sp. TaxID=28214 RepID=UPI003B3A7F40
MDRWQSMRIFVTAAETGSFAEAARHLHMSAPAVTRAVAALESVIGARLFVRTTRSVKLTDSGSRYFDDCRSILIQIREAEAAAAGAYAAPVGSLAVTASPVFGEMFVLPILTEYLRAYPTMSGRALFVDRPVKIVEEGIDVALRIGHLPDSGFTAIKVGYARRIVCAAPEYFQEHGVPQAPADLKDHGVIVSTGACTSPEWRFGEHHRITISPTLQCNTHEAAISAAMAGFGLTRALHYQVEDALADGRLQLVLRDYEEDPLPIHLIHPEGRHAPAKVRAFIDMAVSQLRANRMLN